MSDSADPRSDQILVEPLSARELEILAHMAELRTNREIAELLVLSLNTVKWYARQIYGKLGVDNRRQAVLRARESGLLPASGGRDQLIQRAPPSLRTPTPLYNLPSQATPFIGRRNELAALEALLADDAVRLITITGPGGIGKTRLALSAGAHLYNDPHAAPAGEPTASFSHGIAFVPLAPSALPEDLAPAIAQSLGLSLQRGQDQLLDALRRRQLLLILATSSTSWLASAC